MRLAEIKIGLIEQFFAENANGISGEPLTAIFETLGKSMKLDLTEFDLEKHDNRSSDPSKAFKRFTEGKTSVLMINEDDGAKLNTIFIAIRNGKSVKIANLTTDPISEKMGDLSAVKAALRQAKTIDEDIIFDLTVVE